jgi:hypothetical protein
MFIIEWLQEWWGLIRDARHNVEALAELRADINRILSRNESLVEERDRLFEGLETTSHVLLYYIDSQSHDVEEEWSKAPAPVPRRRTWFDVQRDYETSHNKTLKAVRQK